MKTKAGGSPEYLSQDILDEDFVATFKTFHKFQYLLGSCRVEDKDQFVTSPTRYQKDYTVLCLVLTLISDIILLYMFGEQVQDSVIILISSFILWHGFASCLCVVINARFFNGPENADFIVQMQKLDRVMGLDKVKEINLVLKRLNSCSLFCLIFVFVAMFVLACFNMKIMYVSCVGASYAQITGMVELIHCSNLIIYFLLRVRFINCVIKNHLNRDKLKNRQRYHAMLNFRNKNLKLLALETHDFTTCDTHVYLKELFNLFTIFQNLYRFQLFVFCLKLVFGSLCAFGIVLFAIQRTSVDTMEAISMVLFTVIDIFIAIFIGLRMHVFFAEVKKTKRLSIAVMAEHSTGRLRDKARKMLRMANETPPRLSIYDMYDMNAGTFLSIFGLITSLIVTLLQFAFL